MSDPSPLRIGQILIGSLKSEPMRVETVRPAGRDAWTAGLVGVQTERFRNVTLTPRDIETLSIIDATATYDRDGQLLHLGLEALARGIAYE